MKRVLVADPDCSFLKTVSILLREEFDISHAGTADAVLRKGWKRIEGAQMEAEGYLSRPLDARTLNCEVKRVMDSRLAGLLSWAQILEQTERRLLEEVDGWSGASRHSSGPGQAGGHKSRRRQPETLHV